MNNTKEQVILQKYDAQSYEEALENEIINLLETYKALIKEINDNRLINKIDLMVYRKSTQAIARAEA